MIKEQIITDLKKVLEKMKISSSNLEVEHPAELSHGDYSTNLALKIKKKGFANPVDFGNEIINTWRVLGLPDYLAGIEVVQPGFINLTLKEEFLSRELERVLKEKEKFGSSLEGEGKTVIVDYSGPNIAKPFGIGHLRSTNIGQAIYNLYQFSGWKVIGVNHLGDWGTQFGKLIVAIKKWNKYKLKGLSVSDLEKLYVRFHREAEKKPELNEEAREWFKKLEEKDPEATTIWQTCVDISLREFERVYKLLGASFDYLQGESFYQAMKFEVIDEAKKKKVAQRSQGALIIPLPSLQAPLMLLKSDGTTTYQTRELATIKYRQKKWKPDLLVWETGVDQKLHFQQCFEAAEKLGYGKMSGFVHVAHGLIRMEEGKFSTRQGKTIHLDKVLAQAVDKAEKIIKKTKTERKFNKKEKEEVAQAVGVGAVKYSDLKQNPQTNIMFSWEKIFNLEGDSGPYLQYAYARCLSVLEKAGEEEYEVGLGEEPHQYEPEELAVLRTLYRFPEAVSEAAQSFSPNLVCNFLFDLSQKYNLFYNRHSILKASPKKLISQRLAITAACAQILENGLTLLGIATPEKM